MEQKRGLKRGNAIPRGRGIVYILHGAGMGGRGWRGHVSDEVLVRVEVFQRISWVSRTVSTGSAGVE